MANLVYQLFTSWPRGSITLRELNGHDQMMVNDSSTPTVLALMNNLIVQNHSEMSGLLPEITAEKLSVSDRDLILAGIYKRNYGSRIESTMRCKFCNEQYDLNFLLDDLVAHARREQITIRADDEGYYSKEGYRFRLPNGEDELVTLNMPSVQTSITIFERCVTNSSSNASSEVMDMMEKVGPVLITDINVNCPECEMAQTVQFDMQAYLLTRIVNDRTVAIAEIHSIASAYFWSHKEILDLPVNERKIYASLINQN